MARAPRMPCGSRGWPDPVSTGLESMGPPSRPWPMDGEEDTTTTSLLRRPCSVWLRVRMSRKVAQGCASKKRESVAPCPGPTRWRTQRTAVISRRLRGSVGRPPLREWHARACGQRKAPARSSPSPIRVGDTRRRYASPIRVADTHRRYAPATGKRAKSKERGERRRGPDSPARQQDPASTTRGRRCTARPCP